MTRGRSPASQRQPRTQAESRMGGESRNSRQKETGAFAYRIAEWLDLVERAPCDFQAMCTDPTAAPARPVPWTGTGLAHTLPGGWPRTGCLPAQITHCPERFGDQPEVTQPAVRVYTTGQGPCLPSCQQEPRSLYPPGWCLAEKSPHTGTRAAFLTALQRQPGRKCHPCTPILPGSRRGLRAAGLPAWASGGHVTEHQLPPR